MPTEPGEHEPTVPQRGKRVARQVRPASDPAPEVTRPASGRRLRTSGGSGRVPRPEPGARTRPSGRSTPVPPTGHGAPPVTRPGATGETTRTAGAAFGRFLLGDELGRGGMGAVRVARDRELRRELAIKLMLQADDPDRIERFIEEAQITSQLQHPNIVPVHELGRDANGRPWLAMKRIEGESLGDRIARDRRRPGPLTPTSIRELLALFDKICDGVGFAHSRGVIHRDLKPQNIMVGSYGDVLVVDWGLARPMHDTHSTRPGGPQPPAVSVARRDESAELTVDGEVFGTPGYMPPEQAAGNVDEIDARADIFALGGILYSMLTLQPPYDGDSGLIVIAKAFRHELQPARHRAPQRRIPRELDAIVMKAMARQPGDRYQTVRELQDDLAAFRDYRPTAAFRAGLWRRAVKWTLRHPTTSLLSVMLLVTALVVTTLVSQLQAAAQAAEVAEAQRQKEAAERARAEAEAIANHQRARVAEAAKAAVEGRYDDLVAMGLGQARATRTEAVEAYNRAWEAWEASGRPGTFVDSLTSEQKRDYLRAFDELVTLATTSNYEMTAEDWHVRGVLRAHCGDSEGAIDDLTKALAIRPNHLSLYQRAGARMKLDDQDGALDDLTQALRMNPADLDSLNSRGRLLHRLGRYREALHDFDAIIQLDPENWMAHADKADTWFELGEFATAARGMDEFLVRHPNHVEAVWRRAKYKNRLNDLPGALADADTAVRLDPDHQSARLYRGMIRSRMGEYRAAIEDFNAAIRAGMDSLYPFYNRAMARAALGERELAVADYDRAIEIDPDFPDSHVNRASILLELGRLEEAMAGYQTALAINPDHPEALGGRGVMLYRAGDLDGGLRDLTRAIRTTSSPGPMLATRAVFYMAKGQMDHALRDLNEALRLNPSDAQARHNRAVVYLQRSEPHLARPDLDAAIEIQPDYLDARINRGRILRDVWEDFAGARQDLDVAVRIAPRQPVVYVERAILAHMQGELASAIADYDRALELDPRMWNAWSNRGLATADTDPAATAYAWQQAYRYCPDPTARANIADSLRQLGAEVPDDE